MSQYQKITHYGCEPVGLLLLGWWVVTEHYENGGHRRLGSLVFDVEQEAIDYAAGLTSQLTEVRAALVGSHDRAVQSVGAPGMRGAGGRGR